MKITCLNTANKSPISLVNVINPI